MSLNQRMKKKTALYSYEGIPLNNKKEQNESTVTTWLNLEHKLLSVELTEASGFRLNLESLGVWGATSGLRGH